MSLLITFLREKKYYFDFKNKYLHVQKIRYNQQGIAF